MQFVVSLPVPVRQKHLHPIERGPNEDLLWMIGSIKDVQYSSEHIINQILAAPLDLTEIPPFQNISMKNAILTNFSRHLPAWPYWDSREIPSCKHRPILSSALHKDLTLWKKI